MQKKDTVTGQFVSRSLKERFWEKVNKRGPDECWEWHGSKVCGYGQIRQRRDEGGKMEYAHRISWELAYGPIPEGKCVLHRYDNRGCVNPAHLSIGTKVDNMRDRNEKGWQAHGESIGSAKLTEQDVREICCFLDAGYSIIEIAKGYEVSQATISYIKTGETWSWLTGRGENQCTAKLRYRLE